jgi:acetylglutamate kinase
MNGVVPGEWRAIDGNPFRSKTQAGVITDIVLLATVGIRCVLVHGGGPEINIWLEKVGIKPEFKNGLRVTDGELGVMGGVTVVYDHEWSLSIPHLAPIS